LDELVRAGVPLEQYPDPPHVYWSVPKAWLPGAVQFELSQMLELRRLLSRLPKSQSRAKLLKQLGEALGNRNPIRGPVHVVREAGPQEEQFLAALEDHIEERRTLRFKYFTASRASIDWRETSPYRVDLGPPTRFVAWCHRAQQLRWFRLDHIQSLAPQANDAYHPEPENVQDFITESLDGYHDDTEPCVCSFFVAEEAARWVKYNLPQGFGTTPVHGGVEVSGTTAGIRPLARFVVGLGEQARAITPELTTLVRELADGAMRANRASTPSESRLKARSVRSKRSTG
jgi:predicted DNA-binding transcriptional regulator YafY